MVAMSRAQRAYTHDDAPNGVDVLTGAAPAGSSKATDAFFQDGIGNGARPPLTVPTLVTTDLVPGDTSSTATLTVDGAHITSTIDTIGDQDFYAINMVAGQTYNISMFQVAGGPSGVPLADAYIELYDATGHLLVSADGGGPNTPSGLDAILTFTAEASGTYFVNARAFDQLAQNGATGDYVGDYEVFATSVDANDPTAYHPFYSPDSPLHSIDWGTQFPRTARNPDGDNGTRSDNGVPNGQSPIENNPYGVVGKNVITYYFAETGDVFISDDPTTVGTTETIVAEGMQPWEMDAFERAFHIYEQVADLQYVRVYDRAQADIKVITYEGTPGVGASLLGRMSPPGENNAGQMEINTGDVRWTEEGVQQGGFYFPTLLHELGHGHGMAHPHDNGGHSSVMRGAGPSEDPVEGAIGGQLGDFDLSQQVFTVMSYNDGWQSSPYGMPRSGGITGTEVDHFGWMGTLAALDIAVLQDKYGVNEEWATGDDVYVIRDVNEAGSFFSTIWDGGGTDEIRYEGARDAVIDLRAATLEYEEGGGGRVSYAYGIFDGFTIANGVTIERATGGDGNDTLNGNAAANILSGGLGTDTLNGDAGDDVLIGGGGGDTLNGGAGLDTADYTAAAAAVSVRLSVNRTVNDGGGAVDVLIDIENATGSAFDDTLFGNGSANVLSGGGGRDILLGMAGDDTLRGGAGVANELYGGTGDDRYVVESFGDSIIENAGEGIDTIETALSGYVLRAANVENLVLTAAGGATGTGNASANLLTGGAGDDVLSGRGGADTLNGGGGRDTADYSQAAAGVTVRLNAGQTTVDGDGSSDSLVSIEDVIGSAFADTLIGEAGANHLMGGAGRDVLLGLAGNDVLEGGGGAANELYGGLGDDLYILTSVGDSVIENAGEGVDTVQTTLGGYTLKANVENATYTGSGNFAGIGNASANVITGGAGRDTLTGAGGDDTLIGGAGSDLALMSGVRANYTVTAGANAGEYRITDSVAGRDGVDTLIGIEQVRFNDGTTFLLSDLVAASASGDAPAKSESALVLPGLVDDDFVVGKGAEPQVLPGSDDDLWPTPEAPGLMPPQGHYALEADPGEPSFTASWHDRLYDHGAGDWML